MKPRESSPSLYDRDGQTFVSVLVKRTYDMMGDGSSKQSRLQLPLAPVPEADELAFDPTWKAEPDVAPYKPRTDIVVFGHAFARRADTTSALVSIGVPERDWVFRIRAIGNRTCTYRDNAPPLFSDPEPFEKIPLSFDHAYGGSDPGVTYEGAPADLLELVRRTVRPAGAYPRNPAGLGYVTANRADVIEGLRLPNLEDPTDALTPERLVGKGHAHWHHQPIPIATGWVDAGWFPRCALAGFTPQPEPPALVEEVRRGALPSHWPTQREQLRPSPQFFNGAPAGLQVPTLQGGEGIELVDIGAPDRFLFRLPSKPPLLRVRHRGRDLSLTWALHTVCIFADDERFTVTWRAESPVSVSRPPADLRPSAHLGPEHYGIEIEG